MKKIIFDMDGTLADFYNVNNWLNSLINYDVSPYVIAEPLLNMQLLSKKLKNLQARGYLICIVSWLSKDDSNKEFNSQIRKAKREWLNKYLELKFDEIHLVKYGTNKSKFISSDDDILFDDNINVRNKFKGKAYKETEILQILEKVTEM